MKTRTLNIALVLVLGLVGGACNPIKVGDKDDNGTPESQQQIAKQDALKELKKLATEIANPVKLITEIKPLIEESAKKADEAFKAAFNGPAHTVAQSKAFHLALMHAKAAKAHLVSSTSVPLDLVKMLKDAEDVLDKAKVAAKEFPDDTEVQAQLKLAQDSYNEAVAAKTAIESAKTKADDTETAIADKAESAKTKIAAAPSNAAATLAGNLTDVKTVAGLEAVYAGDELKEYKVGGNKLNDANITVEVKKLTDKIADVKLKALGEKAKVDALIVIAEDKAATDTVAKLQGAATNLEGALGLVGDSLKGIAVDPATAVLAAKKAAVEKFLTDGNDSFDVVSKQAVIDLAAAKTIGEVETVVAKLEKFVDSTKKAALSDGITDLSTDKTVITKDLAVAIAAVESVIKTEVEDKIVALVDKDVEYVAVRDILSGAARTKFDTSIDKADDNYVAAVKAKTVLDITPITDLIAAAGTASDGPGVVAEAEKIAKLLDGYPARSGELAKTATTETKDDVNVLLTTWIKPVVDAAAQVAGSSTSVPIDQKVDSLNALLKKKVDLTAAKTDFLAAKIVELKKLLALDATAGDFKKDLDVFKAAVKAAVSVDVLKALAKTATTTDLASILAAAVDQKIAGSIETETEKVVVKARALVTTLLTDIDTARNAVKSAKSSGKNTKIDALVKLLNSATPTDFGSKLTEAVKRAALDSGKLDTMRSSIVLAAKETVEYKALEFFAVLDNAKRIATELTKQSVADQFVALGATKLQPAVFGGTTDSVKLLYDAAKAEVTKAIDAYRIADALTDAQKNDIENLATVFLAAPLTELTDAGVAGWDSKMDKITAAIGVFLDYSKKFHGVVKAVGKDSNGNTRVIVALVDNVDTAYRNSTIFTGAKYAGAFKTKVEELLAELVELKK